VAIAAATLATAALFSLRRRRVQHAVDRRFNLARYEASGRFQPGRNACASCG